jgi:hypothetical protein
MRKITSHLGETVSTAFIPMLLSKRKVPSLVQILKQPIKGFVPGKQPN